MINIQHSETTRGLRRRQIRLAASAVRLLCRLPGGTAVNARIRQQPLYKALLGYRRPFASLSEAEAAIRPYGAGGHTHPGNVDLHLKLNETPRPSDYVALAHLKRGSTPIRRVFDLGGNAGNLYYCYRELLDAGANLTWQVHDLPEVMAQGRAIAEQRGASNLQFCANWLDASGADVLIVSGSLHYMKSSLAEMIGSLADPPRHLLINRTPLCDRGPFAAIQDAGAFQVACMVHNRDALVRELAGIGYEVVQRWPVTELSLEVPGYPEHAVPTYSGMFLRRTPTAQC